MLSVVQIKIAAKKNSHIYFPHFSQYRWSFPNDEVKVINEYFSGTYRTINKLLNLKQPSPDSDHVQTSFKARNSIYLMTSLRTHILEPALLNSKWVINCAE